MIGDPSVVWIAPVEQRIDRITFSTFNNQNINIQTHHVNIIVNTEDVGSVFLDEVQIPSSAFSPVAGNSDFSFTRKDIQHGVHHLRCDNGFNLFVDHPDIYEDQIDVPIPRGCDSIIDLRLVVTNRIINPTPIVFSGCTDSFTWNGVTYTEDGDYEQVFTSMMGCDSIIQLHVVLTETVEGGTDTITDICSSYEWHGQHYNQSGFYTDTIKNIHGCDSIVHLGRRHRASFLATQLVLRDGGS